MRHVPVFAVLMFALSAADSLRADLAVKPDDNTLWLETFRTAADLKRWLEADNLRMSVADDQWVVEVDMSGQSRATQRSMSFDPEYPYLQFDLAQVAPTTGYQGWSLWANGAKYGSLLVSTAGGYAPGLWTLNCHDFLPGLDDKRSFPTRIDMHGAIFRYNWLRMVKKPVNGLPISVAGDKRALVPGDKIAITAVFEEPAMDCTVTLRHGYLLRPLKNVGNPEGYLQLTSSDEGKTWKGELTIAANRDTQPIKGGSLIFQANILGGKIRRMYTAAPWIINVGKKEEVKK